MARREYVAIIEAADHGYGVFFPDLPGCTSGGDSVEEATLNAGEAAGAWVEVTAEHGEPIPEPTPTDRITVDADVREVTRILVSVELPHDHHDAHTNPGSTTTTRPAPRSTSGTDSCVNGTKSEPPSAVRSSRRSPAP